MSIPCNKIVYVHEVINHLVSLVSKLMIYTVMEGQMLTRGTGIGPNGDHIDIVVVTHSEWQWAVGDIGR